MTVLLTDTSLWVDLLRGTGGTSREQLAREVRRGADSALHICEPVVMELVGGAGSHDAARVSLLVDSLPTVALDASVDFRAAGDLYRMARLRGRTVRSFVDCLIAAIAIRTGSVVVHRDRDFESLAAVSPLQQERWG
jgi:predicted nucleic acid-binding protein